MAQENIQISVPIIGTTANPVAYANQIKDGNTTQSDINTALLKDTADLKQDVEGLATDIAGIEEEVDSKIDGVTFATTKNEASVVLGQGATFRIEPGTGMKVDRASVEGEPIDGAVLSVDTDVIPTKNEVETQLDEVNDAIEQKADKATTLEGYGITDAYTKNELNNLITTPNQKYVTVTTFASLPATGEADTIYRVSSYDGTQTDATKYAEYAWNGTDYILLSVKSAVDEVFDISAYNSNAKYADLAAALGTNGANVPAEVRKGGMSVKFIKNVPATYRVVKSTSDTQPTGGIALATASSIENGTYNAEDLTDFNVLPTTVTSAASVYYFEDSGTYTVWTITMATAASGEYVQYRLMSTAWSTVVANWQGVDEEPTAGSDNLVKSGWVFDKFMGKIDYFIEDVTNTENIRDNTWIKYDYGRAQSSLPAGQWSVRYYSCLGIERLYCKVGSDGSLPASIAFYRQKPTFGTTDTNYYLQDVSVQAQQGIKEYYVEVPKEAAWVVISNRGATFDSPIVKLYSNKSALDIVSNYDSRIIYQSNNTVSSSTINNSFYTSEVENGTQLELEVTEVGGDSELLISLFSDTEIYQKRNVLSGKYYFEKTSGLTRIRLYKSGAEGNLCNWKLRTLTKNYPVQNRDFASFLPAKQVEIINLGTPFRGSYATAVNQDSENTKISSSYWVSWPLQKTNGYVIKIEFDATQYVVNFSSFTETYQTRVEKAITTSPFEIDLSSCRGWNLAIRKTDYSNITPADVEGVITITKVSGTIYEKPLLKYEVEKIVEQEIQAIGDISAIEANANKALTLSEEGYGFNPFIEKPFYYHFKANDFIKDSQNHEAIASESVDDVELAARLGFSLIEANIQSTSDEHFVVIHGTDGTFGPECKSINPDVISTADLQSTAINSVTLQWIKTNVRYDSYYEKYQTTLPSLEEFCEACKKHNIGIFAGTSNKAAIDICVKYLGQNVVVYNSPTNIRTYFNGWCFIWNNTPATTVEQILTACRQKGAPVMYGLGPNLAAQLYADDNMNTLIESMHQEGFLIGWTANYDAEENGRKYLKMGMDFSSSGHEVNPFEANYEVFDIDSDNLPTTTGSVSEGIISLTNNQTITCGNTVKIIGKGWLSIKFNGTLTFTFGSCGNTGRTITSDGSEDIVITDYFFRKESMLTVTAGADTTVTKFLYKTSKC